MTSPPRREKDRWHQLADAIQDSNLPASDKSVFRYLLDCADYVTADLPARFTPTRKTIRRKTSLSYSQVGYSTRHLRLHGWLAAAGSTGPGKPLGYELGIGAACDCTGRVHARNAANRAPATVPTDDATVPTDDPRTLPTNTANAAGQTANLTERHREGGKEAMTGPKPKPTVTGDWNGPADRESFDDWLGLISGRAEPSHGTSPGNWP